MGAAYHPQTQGKLERFHRTLKAEVLNGRQFSTLSQAQAEFDRWRQVYNYQRPHQALELAVPASRYVPSPRAFCLYWPHGGRVFGHMVDTLGASLKLANDCLLKQFFTHSPHRFGAVGEKLEFWIRARTTMRRVGQRWFAGPCGAACGHAPLVRTRSSHDGELRRSICLI